MAAAVTKTVATGKTFSQVVDGKYTVYTAGQTVKVSPQDAIIFTAAGLFTA